MLSPTIKALATANAFKFLFYIFSIFLDILNIKGVVASKTRLAKVLGEIDLFGH